MEIIPAVVLMLILSCKAEAAPLVMSVQSVDVSPYNEALDGFKSACTAETEKLVISRSSPAQIVREVRAAKPDLVLAIGLDALNTLKALKQMPILYLMVLAPEENPSAAPHITGVSMNIPEEKQLRLIHLMLPRANRIGVLYDVAHTGQFVARGKKASRELGIRLLARAVTSSRQVPTTLKGLQPAPDALWLLPDITVIRPETLEFMFQYSLERKIPIICFSKKYLSLGAFMSIDIDLIDMGRQAGEMANRLLSGKTVRQVPPEEARKAVVTVNRAIGDKLGISIPHIPSMDIHNYKLK